MYILPLSAGLTVCERMENSGLVYKNKMLLGSAYQNLPRESTAAMLLLRVGLEGVWLSFDATGGTLPS